MNLCPFCVDWVEKGPVAEDSTAIAHYPTYGALVTSSRDCPLCSCLCALLSSELCFDGEPHEEQALQVVTQHSGQSNLDVSWGEYRICAESVLTPTITEATFTIAIRPSQGEQNTRILVTVTGGSWLTTSITHIGLIHKLSAWEGYQTTWDEKLRTIERWLQGCRDDPNHAGCRPQPFTPSRLVSVGLDGRAPRLIHTATSSGNETMEYATLSYRWGQLLPLRTMTTTLAQFTQELPPKLIPATFVEAMGIARAVGIPYIWIDALCIIQDDIKDWEREAAKIDMVYGGSQLTIAASDSADSSAGCFSLTTTDGRGSRDALFRHHGSGRCVRFYDGDVRDRPTRDSPLSSRGWTLQEQLLSPRVVSCMQPEMHWQCHGSHNVENGLSFGPVGNTAADARVPLRIPRVLPSPTSTRDPVQLRAAWENVVENYSARSLTFEHDRIPAISGILRHFAQVLNDDPVLGLWTTTISRDLAWTRLWVERPNRTQGDPRLPSWSWLACPGAATFLMLNQPLGEGLVHPGAKSHVRLQSWDVQWLGTPYTSPLKSACIQIEAPAMLIDMRPTEEQASGVLRGHYQVFGENLTNTAGEIRYRCFGLFDREDLTTPAKLLCLLLSTERESKGDSIREVFVIVEPVENGRYRRIGAARLTGTTPSFDLQKRMSLVLE